MFCLNLCEIFTNIWTVDGTLENLINRILIKERQIERIYIGSSFCSQYYLNFFGYDRIFALCKKMGIPITLTIPVFTEKDIEIGKRKTLDICEKAHSIIDEITVNDIGMLSWLQTKKEYCINLGRLFFKDQRDCRVPEYTKKHVSPALLSHLADDYWKLFRISRVELDPTNLVIDTSCIYNTNINVGIHMPYCYMTTGNICKFASIHQTVKDKFRPNIQCDMECAHVCDSYSDHVNQTNCDPVLYRFGRTLYFKVDSVKFTGKKASRVIYFPIDEWRDLKDENTGSIK